MIPKYKSSCHKVKLVFDLTTVTDFYKQLHSGGCPYCKSALNVNYYYRGSSYKCTNCLWHAFFDEQKYYGYYDDEHDYMEHGPQRLTRMTYNNIDVSGSGIYGNHISFKRRDNWRAVDLIKTKDNMDMQFILNRCNILALKHKL